MRRSGQPSRPNARICCRLSSPKMLAMPTGEHGLARRVNVLGRCYLTGRFSDVHDWPVLGVRRGPAPERQEKVVAGRFPEDMLSARPPTPVEIAPPRMPGPSIPYCWRTELALRMVSPCVVVDPPFKWP